MLTRTLRRNNGNNGTRQRNTSVKAQATRIEKKIQEAERQIEATEASIENPGGNVDREAAAIAALRGAKDNLDGLRIDGFRIDELDKTRRLDNDEMRLIDARINTCNERINTARIEQNNMDRLNFRKYVNEINKDIMDKKLKNQQQISDIILNYGINYQAQMENASCQRTAGFVPQSHQTFISKYINKQTDNHGLILWHGLGSGKTLSAISAILEHQKDGNAIVVAPASLIGNFSKEILNNIQTISELNQSVIDERAKTQKNRAKSQKKTRANSGGTFKRKRESENTENSKTRKRQKLDPFMRTLKCTDMKCELRRFNGSKSKISFLSSNGDLNSDTHVLFKERFDGENNLIIIDESQLFIQTIANAFDDYTKCFTSEPSEGSRQPPSRIRLYNYIIKNAVEKKFKIIALSGTPIVKDPIELAVLFNILAAYDMKGEELFPLLDKPLLNNNKDERIMNLSFNKVHSVTPLSPADTFNYSQTEPRLQTNPRHNFNEISNVNRVGNANLFMKKVYGYLSYFGNVDKLLPRIILDMENPIGYNNNGIPHFQIKECIISESQQTKIDNIRTLYFGNNNQRYRGDPDNKYLVNFHSISPDYAIDICMNKYIPFTSRDLKARKNFFDHTIAEFQGKIKETEIIYNSGANLTDIQNHSTKMFEIIDHICKNIHRKHIIYCQSRKVNVIFAHYLRQYLNYSEFKGEDIIDKESDLKEWNNMMLEGDMMLEEKKKSMLEAPKYYMYLTGSGMDANGSGMDANNDDIDDKFLEYVENEGLLQTNGDSTLKEKMIDLFNKQQLFSKFNIIILNSAAAEGITLKNVNYVHFLQVPENMSRLYQIIGRAVRNCTHTNLEKDDRFVTPILYLAVPERFPIIPPTERVIELECQRRNRIAGLPFPNINMKDNTKNGFLPMNDNTDNGFLGGNNKRRRIGGTDTPQETGTGTQGIDIIDGTPDIEILDPRGSDIAKYEKIVRVNDNILPYLMLLKKAAIDCNLLNSEQKNYCLNFV